GYPLEQTRSACAIHRDLAMRAAGRLQRHLVVEENVLLQLRPDWPSLTRTGHDQQRILEHVDGQQIDDPADRRRQDGARALAWLEPRNVIGRKPVQQRGTVPPAHKHSASRALVRERGTVERSTIPNQRNVQSIIHYVIFLTGCRTAGRRNAHPPQLQNSIAAKLAHPRSWYNRSSSAACAWRPACRDTTDTCIDIEYHSLGRSGGGSGTTPGTLWVGHPAVPEPPPKDARSMHGS